MPRCGTPKLLSVCVPVISVQFQWHRKIGEKTAFSCREVNSKFEHQGVFGDAVHQDCLHCTVPHGKKYVLKNFDKNWLSVMANCDIESE